MGQYLKWEVGHPEGSLGMVEAGWQGGHQGDDQQKAASQLGVQQPSGDRGKVDLQGLRPGCADGAGVRLAHLPGTGHLLRRPGCFS